MAVDARPKSVGMRMSETLESNAIHFIRKSFLWEFRKTNELPRNKL
jgi:hypothetical protein